MMIRAQTAGSRQQVAGEGPPAAGRWRSRCPGPGRRARDSRPRNRSNYQIINDIFGQAPFCGTQGGPLAQLRIQWDGRRAEGRMTLYSA